jgi:hypothetical protein
MTISPEKGMEYSRSDPRQVQVLFFFPDIPSLAVLRTAACVRHGWPGSWITS